MHSTIYHFNSLYAPKFLLFGYYCLYITQETELELSNYRRSEGMKYLASLKIYWLEGYLNSVVC